MSTIKKLLNVFNKRSPKCYADLYYPYQKPTVCNCLDRCKYGPPPALMERIPNILMEKKHIPDLLIIEDEEIEEERYA